MLSSQLEYNVILNLQNEWHCMIGLTDLRHILTGHLMYCGPGSLLGSANHSSYSADVGITTETGL